jgi:hypothetical protein
MGEHQPGETYYFLPLTVNCFGLANIGLEKAQLTAYVYHEGEGKKGGNNVASLIYKYLDDYGLINQHCPLQKELNWVMDNCRGQNKNHYVLQLATLFVELKYYRSVNIIFLVAGHTKNVADCLFNLLKTLYRKSQVFSMEQLVTVLNKSQYVECVKVGTEDFCNFGKLEDKVYKHTPLSGHTKKYQVFYSNDKNPGILYAKVSNNTASKVHEMDLRKGTGAERTKILEDFDVVDCEHLPVEGIRTIKQVELFSKWRKHVPNEYKSPLYDDPGEAVRLAIKDDRKSKKAYIEQRCLKKEAVDATGIFASQKSLVQKQAVKNQKDPKTARTTATKAATKTTGKRGSQAKQKSTAAKKKK